MIQLGIEGPGGPENYRGNYKHARVNENEIQNTDATRTNIADLLDFFSEMIDNEEDLETFKRIADEQFSNLCINFVQKVYEKDAEGNDETHLDGYVITHMSYPCIVFGNEPVTLLLSLEKVDRNKFFGIKEKQ